jgi:A/G-specific adenine glycosylase
MTRITSVNIQDLQAKLLIWYERNGRDFPWRRARLSAYQLVIAEVLLQRTNANTVAGFYSKFIADFPDWQTIVAARLESIEDRLRSIGLFRQRAKRLKDLASEMVRRKGYLPFERKELESIPLFGQYMSNAVELLVFKKRAPLIDINMARLLERYFEERKMSDIRFDPKLQRLAKKVVNHPESKIISWAILDFAATVCIARKPKCGVCLLKVKCTYFKTSKN